jgi:hypothetical protein
VPASQQNAFLVKARRQLMRVRSGTPEYAHLMSLISEYESLLGRSLSGEDCDDELDLIESRFDEAFGK